MPRIVIYSPLIKDNKITINDENLHYLRDVLRLKKGDIFEILSPSSCIYKAEIKEIGSREIIATIREKREITEVSHRRIVLIQGIPKGEKMELIIQKTTELGVSEIYPVITERTIPKKTDRIDRWRKIAEESTRQSFRLTVPVIHEPELFEKVIKNLQGTSGIILYESEGRDLNEVKDIILKSEPLYCIVGPEGGFSEKEIESAIKYGFIPVNLGERIMRTETAAITIVALSQFLRDQFKIQK